jgi:hypothetical protein
MLRILTFLYGFFHLGGDQGSGTHENPPYP